MSLELKRIYFENPNTNNDYVDYENQLQPRRVFENPELEKLFSKHETELMSIAEKEMMEYLNDDDVCNDADDSFPQKKYITGEWYVSEICFEEEDYLSIETAFIGTDTGEKSDYFSIEVGFSFDEESCEFEFDGLNVEAL